MRFKGSEAYVSTDDLTLAVNAAITLQRPLLVKGEPGTGKTMLAVEVAKALGLPLLEWHIKSTTKAQQGLYEYDAVSRLRDSQLGDPRVHEIRNYIVKGMLWQAFTSETPVVLLIDEIDKADIEFPNDLLRELDRMEFFVYETKELVKATQRPIRSDAVSRLRDSQLGDPRVHEIRNYIVKGMLWQAFTSETPVVLLIDEIDKADIEFPNDLLRELDRMEFFVYETKELVKATQRPI